ncbi:mCG147719 [Mus musculus]|nr:mCG147719 [Mus musculus]
MKRKQFHPSQWLQWLSVVPFPSPHSSTGRSTTPTPNSSNSSTLSSQTIALFLLDSPASLLSSAFFLLSPKRLPGQPEELNVNNCIE